MQRIQTTLCATAAVAALALVFAPVPAAADICQVDDVIVDGSMNIGIDSVCNRSFGFDTLVLSENNLRIYFEDTSSTASFPSSDWRIVINDSSNGGANYFALEHSNNARQPFRVEAGARANALYVEDDGDIGIGTSTPVVDVHIKTGNTPTLRLDQDSSSGFTPQSWDVAGNETNFFIRDATNGSTLPLRIRPGVPTSAIDVSSAGSGRIGMFNSNPQTAVHLRRTDGNAKLFVEEASGTTVAREVFEVQNNGSPIIIMKDSSRAERWSFGTTASDFIIDEQAAAGVELQLGPAGDLIIKGMCNEIGQPGSCADYVFEPGYELLTLGELKSFISENQHLPNVPSTAEIREKGVSVQKFQGRLLEKIEELTLYTIEQQEKIDALEQANQALADLEERLALLEAGAIR